MSNSFRSFRSAATRRFARNRTAPEQARRSTPPYPSGFSAQPAPRRSPQRRVLLPPAAPAQRNATPQPPASPRRAPQRRSRPAAKPVAPTRFRMTLVWGILLSGMFLLTLNLFRIQILQGSMLQERARGQQMIHLNPAVPRRTIVDRVGTVLAIDQPAYTLYAHPILFQEPPYKLANAIAPILKMSPADLEKLFTQGESGIRVTDGLTEDLARQVSSLQSETLQLDGIELVEEQQRLYPQQDLFSNIVGYVNIDRKGQAGVEYSLEKQLQQPIDGVSMVRSGDGSIIPIGLPDNFLQQQEDNLRLQLTLDSRLQRATRLALNQQMDRYSAKRGAVIVMDVQDGSILSLVSEPTYDPNRYYEADMEQLRDWVLSDLYEPGSTFKPINVAIALQAGSVQPDDTFFDEGAIEIGEWPIRNSDFEYVGGRGQISVTEILKYSSNVGMVRLMQTLEPGIYYGWLSRLGLDKPTGIDLPSEAAGQMKSYEQFTNALVEPATTAFGQGFSLTPIKLIQLHAMLANGGKMVTPHVVRGLVDSTEELQWQPDLSDPEPLFSSQNAKAVLKMMEQVVVDGTGEPAQIPGYRIGGKTGTAQKASETGGYTNARITSFVGLFPVEAPRYAILAVIDEPQGEDAYGSTVAAPIVRAVMEALISIEHIPPSAEVDEEEEELLEDRQQIPGNYVPDPKEKETVEGSSEEGNDPTEAEEENPTEKEEEFRTPTIY